MQQDNPTTDLSRFGNRELAMASDLLKAMSDNKYAENTDQIDEVKLYMNTNSGNVFLSNDDGECQMLNDNNEIETWQYCGDCGHEDFQSQMELKDDDKCINCRK